MKLNEVGNVVSLGKPKQGNYYVMGWDENIGYFILNESMPGYKRGNRFPTVDTAHGYLKAYHTTFYNYTKLHVVPEQDHVYIQGIEEHDIPAEATPVNKVVFGFYDPRDMRSGFNVLPDETQQAISSGKFDVVDLPNGFWLPEVQLWIVDGSKFDVTEFYNE